MGYAENSRSLPKVLHKGRSQRFIETVGAVALALVCCPHLCQGRKSRLQRARRNRCSGPGTRPSHRRGDQAGLARAHSPDHRQLVSFGNRSTISPQDEASVKAGTGVGAARNWIKSEFERYSKDCSGCLEVRTDSFIEASLRSASRLPRRSPTFMPSCAAPTRNRPIVSSW